MKKNIIFNSDVYELYKAISENEECIDDVEEVTDDDIFKKAYDDIEMWYEDEQMNLHKTLEEDIVVIAELGLWNGKRHCGKVVDDNLNCILNSFGCDDIEVYADRHNIKSIGSHHDGRNKHLFRMIKPTLSDVQRENFLDRLESGTLTDRDITRYTKSLRPYVAEIYGF